MISGNEHSAVLNRQAVGFEDLYIKLRTNEKRIYTDEEVAWLPEVSEDHLHRSEWEIRKASCKRLLRYLSHKKRSLKILEVGCGNGWLSYHLSQIRHSNVIGLDINSLELQQAERVFGAIPNLNFIHGDLNSGLPEFEKFDMVVFAASIQYFSSLSVVLELVLDRLNEKGEVHITDTHFYAVPDLNEAKQRSRAYFRSRGFDGMDAFYFHHSLKELEGFRYEVFYDPHSIVNKVLQKKNPFYWICVRK